MDTLVDEDTQAEVQVWRYPPALLSEKPGMVDILSLITSLRHVKDERIEGALEELQASLWIEDT
jgi:hypothetical protein